MSGSLGRVFVGTSSFVSATTPSVVVNLAVLTENFKSSIGLIIYPKVEPLNKNPELGDSDNIREPPISVSPARAIQTLC